MSDLVEDLRRGITVTPSTPAECRKVAVDIAGRFINDRDTLAEMLAMLGLDGAA